MTSSITLLIVALTCWGFFKGLYDANIFASVYDVIPAESRGSAAGLMNTIGWLGGGALAPVTIGVLAKAWGLSIAIALTGVIYLLAGAALLLAIFRFVRRDSAEQSALPHPTR
jgi:MFS family permease